MKPNAFEESYNNSVKTIDSMNLSEDNKKELLRMMEEMKYEHNRLNNYYQLNMEVLEEEKKILLNHFIQKDADANSLYSKLQKYESSYFYRILKKFSRIVK